MSYVPHQLGKEADMDALMNPIPPDWKMHEKIKADTEEKIKTHDMSVIGVFANPSFSYTIGLFDRVGYEILCVGLRPDMATYIFNTVRDSLKEGMVIEPGKIYTGEENKWTNLPIKFERITKENDLFDTYAVQAMLYWRKLIPVLQMVLSDKEGRLPEDPEYDHAYMDVRQPILY